ncbi:hypothetical protein, partial [Pseudomonas aeruginosa]|uniref:hypothetical protein n=1 Tax=Pseudomonas aeruginosa TaxID=287 RepID=UPI002B40BA00
RRAGRGGDHRSQDQAGARALTAETLADPVRLAVLASWIATGLGFGLWLWSWFLGRTPVKQMRLRDCGVVMVFSGILVRVITQDRAYGVFD